MSNKILNITHYVMAIIVFFGAINWLFYANSTPYGNDLVKRRITIPKYQKYTYDFIGICGLLFMILSIWKAIV